ncbi:hypothetical protein [Roseicitreum antarcticum]|uniref:Uncharacterized protein n=1 Tax=Roseicitreum antarcticum TaxID=564137 RepID=A0A1H2XCG6_9RHOB|nr:hypothetical protein [Roseicitreum antarcticum]SDW90428.1 hypothetical protein SAMN04488238_104143 [Roseicitreum antarcticum]
MPHDWLMNVLNDLRAYALRNGLPAIANQMGEARIVAAAELAALEEQSASTRPPQAVCYTGH